MKQPIEPNRMYSLHQTCNSVLKMLHVGECYRLSQKYARNRDSNPTLKVSKRYFKAKRRAPAYSISSTRRCWI